MSKNVILVGMPRSGTSMTTNIFAKSGYFVAEDEENQLRQGDEHNPSGYWEAKPLIDANANIFKNIGYPFDNTWLYQAINNEQSEAIFTTPKMDEHQDLVNTYNLNSPWIWKDPRLCYTLPYWWSFMDANNTIILLLKRDPLEIVQSFLRLKWRGHSPEEKTETLSRIKAHIEFAESAIKRLNIPFVEVSYSDYSNNPEKIIQSLNKSIGLMLTVKDLGYDANLNHHGLTGKVKILLERIVHAIPGKLRKNIKGLIPMFLLKKIYPHRYK